MDFDHHLEELSSSSQCIPSSDDFRFYYNFTEFRRPIEEIAKRSQSMLNKIGSSENIWGRGSSFPVDVDDAYEWLVNANDDVLELVDELVGEFEKVMKEYEGENGSVNKKKGASHLGDEMNETKPKVSFHVSTLRKPQYHYNIVVNNANQPFEHFLLQKSDDGLRFIHPLEKFSVLDFVDKENLENLVPLRPPSLESTPFKLVEEVQGLKELAAKLCSVNEYAVDLEHNQYRSFQGLTCLMQISTRTEDFVVDTLKLRNHVGPYLREVFKDPTKKKVMHGANRDIVWLQRDFGIYVCNMFDTGQASRVLKLERYSLQYLLQQFCGVTANKEYQNADWRVRPLPDVMLRYGREDTHYLLYIYDLMRIKLFALPKEPESSDDPLLEVYKRSYDVCMQLYEKDLLTEDSYLRVKGLRGAGFNAQQLAIVSGLCEWRDVLARAEDESTGYILPNKIILEIAKQMPVTTSTLRRLVGRSKLSYVERSLDIIVNIVRHSMQNAAAFEEAALRLKEEHAASVSNIAPVKEETEAPLPHSPNLNDECAENGSFEIENATCVNISENLLFSSDMKGERFEHEANVRAHSTAKGNGANVQVRKMPTGACDATLPGNSASEEKCDIDKKGKEEIKVEQIRSPVNLPCHPFLGNNEKSKLVLEAPTVASETSDPQKPLSGSGLGSTSTLDGIIPVDLDSDSEDMMQNNL